MDARLPSNDFAPFYPRRSIFRASSRGARSSLCPACSFSRRGSLFIWLLFVLFARVSRDVRAKAEFVLKVATAGRNFRQQYSRAGETFPRTLFLLDERPSPG